MWAYAVAPSQHILRYQVCYLSISILVSTYKVYFFLSSSSSNDDIPPSY